MDGMGVEGLRTEELNVQDDVLSNYDDNPPFLYHSEIPQPHPSSTNKRSTESSAGDHACNLMLPHGPTAHAHRPRSSSCISFKES